MSKNELKRKSSITSFIIEHQLLMFFIFAFAITWGIAGAVIMLMPLLVQVWGPLSLDNPYYFTLWMIAVYGSPISAFIIISIAHGKEGLQAYLRRLLNWRFKIVGVILLLSILIIGICANLLYISIGGTPKDITQPWYMLILLSLFMLIYDPGPMEELGWRGFALPHLQQKYNALWSSIILGIIWGIWHLPAFFIAALAQSSFSLSIFIIQTISLSIIMTAAYNKSEGSIPLAFLMHWLANLGGLFFNIQSVMYFLIYAILLTIVAVLIIILFGPENLGESKYTIPIPLNIE